MSPNEFQLRETLHAGEGEPVDPDAVIARARSARRQRRTAAGAVGGAIAAVLAVGLTVAVIAVRADGSPSAASGAVALPSTSDDPRYRTSLPGTTNGPAACPPHALRVALPVGSTGVLFPDGVTAIRVCIYQAVASLGVPGVKDIAGSYLLEGTAARDVADRFNALPPISTGAVCTADLGPDVVLLAVTPAGRAAPAVGNLGGCGSTTNGVAAHNARDLLVELVHRGLPQGGPTGRMSPGPGPS